VCRRGYAPAQSIALAHSWIDETYVEVLQAIATGVPEATSLAAEALTAEQIHFPRHFDETSSARSPVGIPLLMDYRSKYYPAETIEPASARADTIRLSHRCCSGTVPLASRCLWKRSLLRNIGDLTSVVAC